MEYPFASNFSTYSYFGMDFAIFTLKIKKLTMKKTLELRLYLFRCSWYPLLLVSIQLKIVVAALKSGNAAQLSKYFDGRVDISLPN